MQGAKMLAIFALATSVAAPQPVAAQHGFEPLVLAPTSDWVLDYGEEYCGLARRFGEGESEVTLQIANFGGTSYNRVFVIGGPVPRANGPSDGLRIRMGSMTEFSEERAVMGQSAGRNSASLSMVFMDPALHDRLILALEDNPGRIIAGDPQFEGSITKIDFDFGDDEFTLLSGPLKPALDALWTCRDDLLASWGVDPAVQNGLSRLPAPTQSTLSHIQNRYPSAMLRSGQSAYIPVRALVDERGGLISCVVQVPSGNESFDSIVCDGLIGGFEPGLDASGNPVRALYTTSIFYAVGG